MAGSIEGTAALLDAPAFAEAAWEHVRILFDGHQLGRHQTGNETYVRELLIGLAGRPSIDVHVAVDGGVDLAGIAGEGLKRVELPRRAVLRLPAFALASRRLAPDVVHSMYYLPPRARRPVVVSIHDVSFERFPEFFSRRELYKNRLAIRWSAGQADLVLALTEHARSEIGAVYGLAPDRIVVVPAGVSDAFLRASHRHEALEPVGGQWRILAVGAIQPRKNLPRLMGALRRVAEKRPVTLTLIGPEGHAAAGIRAQLSNAAVTVQATGYVEEARLVDEYLKADVFVYPSIYEGFGIPVIEAMACGTPVVTSTGGALPEVAGDAALLVDPHDVDGLADAIIRVMEDDDLRGDMVRRGRARAQQFTWSAAVDRLIDAYRRVAPRSA